MARANVETILPLDRFAFRAGINPLHFNQVFVRDIDEFKTCDVPVLQHGWQHAGRTGRDEIAECISSAEAMITDELGFYPAPRWVRDDTVFSTRPSNALLTNYSGYDIRGLQSWYKLDKGYIRTGGVESFEQISEAASVFYSDLDGDGYKESAVVAFSTQVADPAEIALYYPDHGTEPEWEIRPFRHVSIDEGICTVGLWRHQLVTEDLLETLNVQGVDGICDMCFLTTVMAYRRFNDLSLQVVLQWDDPLNCAATGCTFQTQNGCLGIRDPRNSLVAASPGNFNEDTLSYDYALYAGCRAPDKITAYYKAGWPLDKNRNMDPIWELAITRMALGMLQRPICHCQPLENALRYWAEDLAYIKSTPVEGSSHRVPQRMLENPLGTTRGAVWAWNLVVKHRLGQAVLNA